MKNFLSIIQIFIALLLIIFILLQERGTALSSTFGGSGGFYASRRGLQKKIFWATIILGSLFIIFALLNLIF